MWKCELIRGNEIWCSQSYTQYFNIPNYFYIFLWNDEFCEADNLRHGFFRILFSDLLFLKIPPGVSYFTIYA